jgi:hypothetical protein
MANASRKKLPANLRDDVTVNYVYAPRPRRFKPVATLATQKPAPKKSK